MKRYFILYLLCYSCLIFAQDANFSLDDLTYKEAIMIEHETAISNFMGSWWPWNEQQHTEKTLQSQQINFDHILDLESLLSAKIIGQPQAIQMTVQELLCYAAGVQNPQGPIATLLYIGPTGVGKTELAKELARQLYGSEDRLIRLNMSEFSHRETGLYRLIGAPHGYKDSEKGGLLSNSILEHPQSIILLDEFEKAHPTVRTLFLHIFDEGFFTSSTNQVVDCQNCIFIATTNIGAQEILNLQKDYSLDNIHMMIEPTLINILSAELYNRMTPVIFQGLTPEAMFNLVSLRLKELKQRIKEKKQIYLSFEDSLIHYLCQTGYHPQLGARPLSRLIKNKVESAIAWAIIHDQYQAQDRLTIAFEDGILIRKQAEKEQEAPLQ